MFDAVDRLEPRETFDASERPGALRTVALMPLKVDLGAKDRIILVPRDFREREVLNF